MKACQYKKVGSSEVLEIVTVPQPVRGKGEVIIQIVAAGYGSRAFAMGRQRTQEGSGIYRQLFGRDGTLRACRVNPLDVKVWKGQFFPFTQRLPKVSAQLTCHVSI